MLGEIGEGVREGAAASASCESGNSSLVSLSGEDSAHFDRMDTIARTGPWLVTAVVCDWLVQQYCKPQVNLGSKQSQATIVWIPFGRLCTELKCCRYRQLHHPQLHHPQTIQAALPRKAVTEMMKDQYRAAFPLQGRVRNLLHPRTDAFVLRRLVGSIPSPTRIKSPYIGLTWTAVL